MLCNVGAGFSNPSRDTILTAKKKTSKNDFESSLAALEEVVERLEDGDLPLETAVKEWEKGMKLRDACEKILTQAEQKVDVLMRRGDGHDVEPLDPDA